MADEVFSPRAFSLKGNLTLFLGIVSPLARPSVGGWKLLPFRQKPPKAAGVTTVARKRGDPNFQSCSEFLIWSHAQE